MRALRAAVGGAVALSVACTPSELGPPLPAEVKLRAVGSSTVALDRLRIAALYRADGATEITADVTVTATGTEVVGTLVAPTIDFTREPVLLMRVGAQGVLAAHAVRFFGYLDADGSGGFSNGPDLSGPDVLVAIAQREPSYAWIPELGAQLSRQLPEDVESYYALTGGRYTAFLRFVTSASPEISAQAAAPLTIPVVLDSPDLVRHRLLCGDFGAGEGPEVVRVRIDPSAGGEPLCALAIPDCATATVAELDAPELPREDVDSFSRQTLVQCRRSGSRVSLVVEESRVRCEVETCGCQRVTRVDAIVTSTGTLPRWWPCGDTVDVCDSSLPLYRADPRCAL